MENGKLKIILDGSHLPMEEAKKLIREFEVSIAIRKERLKLVKAKLGSMKEAKKWLKACDALKDVEDLKARWLEIVTFEELLEATRRGERIGKKNAERLMKPKPAVPELPIVKIDRSTSDELLPLFLTKGIFSNFNAIPDIQDVAAKESERLGRPLTLREQRQLEIQTGEYKKEGKVWKEFENYAIGFGFEQFGEYLDAVEKEYQAKLKEVEARPFMYPGMSGKIDEVLKRVRLYKKGQSLAYGILGEVYLQQKWYGVVLPKERAVHYIGTTPDQKNAYDEVKRILNSLRWLEYKVIPRGTSKLKGAIGNFIFNILENNNNYIVDVNPRYVGCIQHFAEDKKELRSKKERKELFKRGYFNFPLKALAVSGKYSRASQEFMNYVLREAGNAHLNTKRYKVLSQKVEYYIGKARLYNRDRVRNFKMFKDVLTTLIRDGFIDKVEPSLNKLNALTPKKAYGTNLKLYVPRIKKLDKKLEEVLEKNSHDKFKK